MINCGEFASKRNRVSWAIVEGKKVVIKKYNSIFDCNNEVTQLKKLSAINVPKLLVQDGDTVTMEYISGNLLLEEYLVADSTKAYRLGISLGEFVKSYVEIEEKIFPSDENFRNYIINEKGCFRIDLEIMESCSYLEWIAKIVSFGESYKVESGIKEEFLRGLKVVLGYNDKDIEKYVKEFSKILKKRWKNH